MAMKVDGNLKLMHFIANLFDEVDLGIVRSDMPSAIKGGQLPPFEIPLLSTKALTPLYANSFTNTASQAAVFNGASHTASQAAGCAMWHRWNHIQSIKILL